MKFMELHTIFRAFLPINVTLEMVSNVTLTWCVAASMALLSLIHLLDAAHRIGSRIPERSSPTRSLSVELMQAWLYVRLIAYLMLRIEFVHARQS